MISVISEIPHSLQFLFENATVKLKQLTYKLTVIQHARPTLQLIKNSVPKVWHKTACFGCHQFGSHKL